MCSIVLFWVVALVLIGTSHPSDADVIESDWKNEGDGLLTYDISNGREWLELTETLGMPREELLPELDVSGEYEGFSIASVAEVRGLAASAGITVAEDFAVDGEEVLILRVRGPGQAEVQPDELR